MGWAALIAGTYQNPQEGYTQTVASYTIQPNTVYTLSVMAGGRAETYIGNYSFAGSLISLSDPTTNTTLASTEIPVDSPDAPYGSWVLSSATFTTGSSAGPIGDLLQIGLFDDPSESEGIQTWFYDVQLDASPAVPEPSTLIIWSLLGVLSITVGRRCRR